MVTVHFKLADRESIQLDTDRPETLAAILEMCSEKLDNPMGSVIVVRAGKVVARQALVELNDILDVYPAISGG